MGDTPKLVAMWMEQPPIISLSGIETPPFVTGLELDTCCHTAPSLVMGCVHPKETVMQRSAPGLPSFQANKKRKTFPTHLGSLAQLLLWFCQ